MNSGYELAIPEGNGYICPICGGFFRTNQTSGDITCRHCDNDLSLPVVAACEGCGAVEPLNEDNLCFAHCAA
jgi:hypothetical protein